MNWTLEQRELARRIYEQILEHPESHRQDRYVVETPCGTAGCVAGWAVMLTYPAGVPGWGASLSLRNGATERVTDWVQVDDVCVDIDSRAMELLGVDSYEAWYLFNTIRTSGEVLDFLAAMAAGNRGATDRLVAGRDVAI